MKARSTMESPGQLLVSEGLVILTLGNRRLLALLAPAMSTRWTAGTILDLNDESSWLMRMGLEESISQGRTRKVVA